MNRFRSITTGVAITVLVAATMAFAQGPRGGGPFGGRGRGPGGPFGAGFALGQLSLTDAQRDQVQEIRQRYREQTQAAMQKLAEATEKQRDAINTLPVNEALITSLTQDMTAAQVEVALQQARLNADIWSVLTPEQQAQATKLRAEREQRIEERRQQMQQRRQNRQ